MRKTTTTKVFEQGKLVKETIVIEDDSCDTPWNWQWYPYRPYWNNGLWYWCNSVGNQVACGTEYKGLSIQNSGSDCTIQNSAGQVTLLTQSQIDQQAAMGQFLGAYQGLANQTTNSQKRAWN